MTIYPIVYNEKGYSKVVTAFLTEADAVMYCDSMNAINKMVNVTLSIRLKDL